MSNFISLEKAKGMVATYKSMKDKVLKPEHLHVLPFSETFDRTQFELVLANPECKSLRVHYGMNADHVLHAIIVGVNANGEDILTGYNATTTGVSSATSTLTGSTNPITDGSTTTSTDPGNTGIIEDGTTCPPVCPTTGL